MDQTKIINNFIDESDCQALISRLEYLISNGDIQTREDGSVKVTGTEDEFFSPIVEKYKQKAMDLFPNEYIYFEGYVLIKYVVGVGMAGHQDCKEGQTMGVLMYLNDDYEGGELVYNYTDTDSNTIKPKAGDMIYFPFWYFHEVNKVTSGTRYFFAIGLNSYPGAYPNTSDGMNPSA